MPVFAGGKLPVEKSLLALHLPGKPLKTPGACIKDMSKAAARYGWTQDALDAFKAQNQQMIERNAKLILKHK